MKHSYSKMVENVEFQEFVTGPYSTSQTTRWSIRCTDLGIPFYSRKDNCMYIAFGDTFNTDFPTKGGPEIKWRGNILGRVYNTNVSNGLIFNEFISDEKGDARALITAHHDDNDAYKEVTKIIQGGIEVNGALYLFYESIRHWGQAGYWDINYTGAIKSTDHGETWERVYDLTWPETDKGEFAGTIKSLAEEDMNHQPSGVNIDISDRVAPFFGQIFPVDGKDGYIYIYGRRGGRQFGVKCGRVKSQNFEKFNEYEYFVGFDKDGNAKWVKGTKGLKAVAENDEDSYIFSNPTSNMTVFYNNYLGKWIAIYYKSYNGIMFRTADTPYGPFSGEEMLLSMNYPLPAGQGGLYGGFGHELFQSDNGKTIYFIASQWNKQTYNSMLYRAEFK